MPARPDGVATMTMPSGGICAEKEWRWDAAERVFVEELVCRGLRIARMGYAVGVGESGEGRR